jgi:hypothetical protein
MKLVFWLFEAILVVSIYCFYRGLSRDDIRPRWSLAGSAFLVVGCVVLFVGSARWR